MPRYPYKFIQADAITWLDEWLADRSILPGVEAIHASPRCQHYSHASNCRPGLAAKYPDLVQPVRERLIRAGVPYIIENVPGAPLINRSNCAAATSDWPSYSTGPNII